jgi:hypothetical protein
MKTKVNRYKRKNIKNTNKIKGGAFALGALSKMGSMQTLAAGAAGASGALSVGNFSDMTFTKFLYLSMEALLKTVASITTLPIRNVDELIPPEICKKFANPFACSQSVLQYAFTGTKPDNKKVLPESDKNDCISYDEDGNKLVHCKQKGGSRRRTRKNNSKYNLYHYGGKHYGGKQYGGKGMILNANAPANAPTNANATTTTANATTTTANATTTTAPANATTTTNTTTEIKKKKMIKYLNQNLKLLLHKLKKLNTYLRKYLSPKKKVKRLIEKVNDVRLLEKTLEVCDTLLKNYTYDVNKSHDERLQTCDDEYNQLGKGKLKVEADTKHLGLLIFPRDGDNCDDCSQASLWAETLGKYYSLIKGSINGNHENIHYIIMSIIQDMAKLDVNQNDVILVEITNILKNIECRSNLRQVIKDRIKDLKQ